MMLALELCKSVTYAYSRSRAKISSRPWCFVMKSAAEYRAYAEQCIESVKTAHSQEARDALLEMARVWIDAAHQSEGLRATQRTTKPER